MEHQVLVSIIIPVYNVAEYLDACIDSACNQTYKKIEIILVDDGSTDGKCPAICDKWAQKDNRIRVIHQANSGLSGARNAGLNVALGKYVYFLDGDDSVKPELLETVVAYMESGYDLVAFQLNRYNVDTGEKTVEQHLTGIFDLTTPEKQLEFISTTLLDCNIGWEAWSRIFSRELIEKHNLRFADNKKVFAEDLYFSLCYCAHIEKAISISNILYNYTIREASIMSKEKGKFNIGRMDALAKAVYKFYTDSGDCQKILEIFPVIYYKIIRIATFEHSYLTPALLRKAIYNDLCDSSFFREQAKLLYKNKAYLIATESVRNAYKILNQMRFWTKGNYLWYRIQNRFVCHLGKLEIISSKHRERNKVFRDFAKNKKRIYYIGSETYWNVGDMQIAESILEFLKFYFPEYAVIEIPALEYEADKVFLKKYIQPKDIIVLTGGGNFGDQYPFAEHIRTDVIMTWGANPKVVFPQTIWYTKGSISEKMLREAQKIYTKENNVLLIAREQPSFVFAQEHFSCKIDVVPDIVLFTTNKCDSDFNRNTIVLCFRRDVERNITDEQSQQINDAIKGLGLETIYADTQKDYRILKDQRVSELDNVFKVFSGARLVITDRLHGLIFSAITGTPCIALNNYNHKVSGTFEWLKGLPYISFANTTEEAISLLPDMLKNSNFVYDNAELMPYYNHLNVNIRQMINGIEEKQKVYFYG